MEYVSARFNLSKDGPEILKRICKAGTECNNYCEHSESHIVSIACWIKCCNVQGKNVRCIPIK